jgi:hypothetical protein
LAVAAIGRKNAEVFHLHFPGESRSKPVYGSRFAC